MKIDILGSVDGLEHYTVSQMAALLATPPVGLSYGAAFMGRPSTVLHASDTAIVKVRDVLDLNEEKGQVLVQTTLQQERQLNVHHPHKTWFLWQQGETFKIGNICPRLVPIHTLPLSDEDAIQRKMDYLAKIYQQYFHIARQFALRLDEGQSNFGLDDHQHLYYLDDDLYAWDDFVSFSHLLGVLIRSSPWLDENRAAVLGHQLQQLISQTFGGDTARAVADKLADIYIPNDNRQRVLEIMVAQLQQLQSSPPLQTPQPMRSLIATPSQEWWAIFSDIHANLPALQAVLAYLHDAGITQGLVLGDIVGYGPHPAACIDCLRDTAFVFIKGNHDHAVASGESHYGMSKMAQWAVDWTIPRLTPAQRQWLNDLPLEWYSSAEAPKKWHAVHGAPIDPNYFYGYVYQMTYEENLAILAERGIDWCFHGHSHIQGAYVTDNAGFQRFINPTENLSLTNYQHALICPGAVGQPRDGCLEAQFALYHPRTQEVQFKQIDYARDKTVSDMQAFDFPGLLWQRLLRGI